MAKMNAPTAQQPAFPQAPQQPVAQAPQQPPQQPFADMPGSPVEAPQQLAAPPQMNYNPAAPQMQYAQQIPYAQPQQFPAGMPMAAPPMAPPQPQAQGGPPSLASMSQGMSLASMLGTVDFTQVQSGGGGRLLPVTDPQGGQIVYEARVVKAQLTTAKSGNPMVALQLECTFPQDAVGVKMFDNCVLVDTAMWKFKSLVSACELMSPDGKTFAGNDVTDLQDNIVAFTIVHQDDNNGVPRNNIAGEYTMGTKSPGLTPLHPQPQAHASPNFG